MLSKKLLFIINPKAGKLRAKAGNDLMGAMCAFSEAGYLIDARATTAQGDAAEFARTLSSEYDLIVCCGGDGTLNETVSGLLQCPDRPPLGYLPAGSTNDFAASLHLPRDGIAEIGRAHV